MISRNYNAIYIHQRKSAGTSIIRSFGLVPEMREWHLYNDGVLAPEWSARSAKEKDYFVFSSVRNPFDRLVSAWKYLKSTRHRPLEEVLADPPREGHDYRHFTRTQAAILREGTSGQLVVDDLIRYESLQSDYNRISHRLGKPLCCLEQVNVTTRDRNWRPYFSASDRKMAEEIFQEDLALFDYAF